MNVARAIRMLAQWPESGHLVLSLYLNTHWRDEQQREKVRIFVKDRLRELEKSFSGRKARWAAIRPDVKFIREYVDGLVSLSHDAEYDGIALICCDHEGLRTVIRSRIPFENAFHVAPRPRIRPLAHLYDEYETAIFADVGSTDAAIHLVEAGEIDRSVRIENDVPGRHKQGGWSQARFGRHIEDMMDHHHREVAEQLVRMADVTDCRNIVLSGADHVVSSFRTFLPRNVDDSVIAVESLPRDPDPEKVVEATIRCLRQAERAREEAVIRRVVEMRGNASKVAVGLENVLNALAHGRVQRLLLARDFAREGFSCRACGKLSEAESENGCSLCGEPVSSTDLAEAMVVAAIQRGGEVDEMVDRPELAEMGGVAALLRF
jgi:peptide subunit release factor 1 (eRF1)